MRALIRAVCALLFVTAVTAPTLAGPPIFPIPSDAQARQYAAVARPLGNVGMRLIPGRVYNASYTAETTYEMLMAVSCPVVSAVRVVLVAGNTSSANAATVTVNGQIRAVSDTTDATSNAVTTQKNLAWSAATTASLAPSASSNRRAFLISDWITVPSVARTDGGTYPLFAIRIHATAGQIVVTGNGTQSFTPWATAPSGLIYQMRYRASSTDYSSSGNWSNFNASSAASTASGTPIAGLIYICNGKVVNIFGNGDSITEGQGTRIGEGFGVPAAVALTVANASTSGLTYEWSNMGWAGQTTPQILQNLKDQLAAGLYPTIEVLPSGSPNDIGNASITQAIISGAAGGVTSSESGNLSQELAAIASAPQRIDTILWTWLPTNNTVNNYGATDSLRRAYNATIRGMATRGQVVADFDYALTGVSDANGQVQMVAGSTTDGIHPNDSGNAILAPLLQKAINQIVLPPTGALITGENIVRLPVPVANDDQPRKIAA